MNNKIILGDDIFFLVFFKFVNIGLFVVFVFYLKFSVMIFRLGFVFYIERMNWMIILGIIIYFFLECNIWWCRMYFGFFLCLIMVE